MIFKRINLCRSMQLLDLPMAQEHEWVDDCSLESFCNVNGHFLSLSMIVALNLVHFKETVHRESSFRSHRNFDVSFSFSVKKESQLASKEMTDWDFVSSNVKILHSSIGSLKELRRVILDCCGLKILPINVLPCLRYFEEPNLSCRQMNHSLKPKILFDVLLSLRDLFVVGCNGFFKVSFSIFFLKVPDTIGTWSYLHKLSFCKGRFRSMPPLPPSLKDLVLDDCMSLETISFSTTSGQEFPLLRRVSLQNCGRLRFIPRLLPSLEHLFINDCMSL